MLCTSPEKRTYILSITRKTRKIIITLLHTFVQILFFFFLVHKHTLMLFNSRRTYFYLFHSLPHFLALLPFSNFFSTVSRQFSVSAPSVLCDFFSDPWNYFFLLTQILNSIPPHNLYSLKISHLKFLMQTFKIINI